MPLVADAGGENECLHLFNNATGKTGSNISNDVKRYLFFLYKNLALFWIEHILL